MSHFAKVNSENIVVQVIVAEQDFIDSLPAEDGISWIQTSYNTFGGKHYNPETGEEDDGLPLRKNYAGIGFTYNPDFDAFIPPQPYESWSLNEETCLWEAPIPMPEIPVGDDGVLTAYYKWSESQYNETNDGWLLVTV